MKTPADTELVISLQNGDISSGGILYERYKRNIYYFVVKMVKSDEAAQDIVQDVFIRMIEKIGSLQNADIVKQWLFAIARNESLMFLRRKNLVLMEGLEASMECIIDGETPDTKFRQQETRQLVHDAISVLAPPYREIILLQLTGQLSYEEIAEITQSTVSAVRSKLHKARIALAKQLSPMIRKEMKS